MTNYILFENKGSGVNYLGHSDASSARKALEKYFGKKLDQTDVTSSPGKVKLKYTDYFVVAASNVTGFWIER